MRTADLIEKLVQVGLGLAVFAAVVGLVLFLVDKAPKKIRDVVQLVAYLAPALILLAIGLIYPAVRTSILAFTNKAGDFIGLTHFEWIFTQPDAVRMVLNTII